MLTWFIRQRPPAVYTYYIPVEVHVIKVVCLSVYVFFCPFPLSLSPYPLLSKPSLRGGSTLSNPQHDNRHALATLDSTLEGGADDMAVVDATSLRRQIVKLNRRLQLLEEENKERVKREMIMYSLTVAFWLINSWVLFRR